MPERLYQEGDVVTSQSDPNDKLILRGGQWVPFAPEPLAGVPGSSHRLPASAVIADRTNRTFLNNLMAIPSASGDLLAGGAGLVQTIAETPFTNDDSGFVSRLRGNYESQQGQFPASALRSIPKPTVSDVTSAAKSIPALVPGGESFGDAMQRNSTASQMAIAQQAEQNPGATSVGNALGDVMTLATGRQPFAQGLVSRSGRIPQVTNKATREALEVIAREQPDLVPQIAELVGSGRLSSPGAQRLWTRIMDSGPVHSVLRGMGKAAETSLEGAFLAAIKENDPLMNAGLAGGAQAAASMASTAFGMPTSLKNLAVKAGGMFALFRVAQEFAPGENNSFAAADTAFDKMALAFTIGLGSQVLGGRFRGSETLGRKFAEDLPRISDAINSIPRGVILSLINQAQEEEENGTSVTIPALEMLSTNPQRFPDGIRNRLRRALDNNNFPQEIQNLRNNPAFTDALDSGGV